MSERLAYALTHPLSDPSTDHIAAYRRHEAELQHLVCDCDDDVALCGLDVSALRWDEEDEDEPCPMCYLADEDPCPRCGGAHPGGDT